MRTTTSLLALTLAGSFPLAGVAVADEEVKVGDQAPTFTLPLYNAEAQQRPVFSLESVIGPDSEDPGAKALLLSFFATFCAPCKREMPYLEKLQETYRDQGLRVAMVSIDRDDDAAAKVEALAKQNRITFPILKDRFNFLARRYLGDTAPLPSVFLIGKDGTIQMLNRGYGKDASTFLATSVQEALGLLPKGQKTGPAVASSPAGGVAH